MDTQAPQQLGQKPAWTFTSNSCGYMLFKNGEPQGGAGTLGTATHTRDGRARHWKHRRADSGMFKAAGQRECDRRNAGSA
ncbi:hypothetical protein ABIC83_002851 [Roseateles asaccharophilus]|uniref:hypothetical protein n=1 Tax=Roseateles asaccharophilus TaxID=582607 RepID=UPI00383347CA